LVVRDDGVDDGDLGVVGLDAAPAAVGRGIMKNAAVADTDQRAIDADAARAVPDLEAHDLRGLLTGGVGLFHGTGPVSDAELLTWSAGIQAGRAFQRGRTV